jgi:hypothetical protein
MLNFICSSDVVCFGLLTKRGKNSLPQHLLQVRLSSTLGKTSGVDNIFFLKVTIAQPETRTSPARSSSPRAASSSFRRKLPAAGAFGTNCAYIPARGTIALAIPPY